MRLAATASLLALALIAAVPARAAWAPDGNPLCRAPGSQYASDAVPTPSGGAIVFFSDGRIGAQCVGPDGSIAAGWGTDGNPISHSTGSSINPHAAPDGAGGAFVVWEDNRTDVADLYAQHVLASGAIDPSWPPTDLPVAVGPFNQYTHAVAADGAGGALVVWQDDRNAVGVTNLDIYAQRLGPGGASLWTPNGVAVCIESGDQWRPKVIGDGLGGAYLAWEDERSGHPIVYAQHLTAAGGVAPGWPPSGIQVGDPGPIGAEHDPSLAPDGAGGVLIAWTGSKNNAVYHPFVQRLGPAGAPAPGWPAIGAQLCDLLQTQDQVRVVSDRTGGAIVVWHDFRDVQNPVLSFHIYAQRVNAVGARQWTLNGVPVCVAPGTQESPAAVSDDQGGVVVAWQDSRAGADASDIYALRLLPNGQRAPAWDLDGTALCTQPGAQNVPVIVPDGLSGAIVAWTDSRPVPRFQAPDIWATRTPDDIVVPVQVSLVNAAALPDRVVLAWQVPTSGVSANVWRRTGNEAWTVIGTRVSGGDGRLTFEDRDVRPGGSYEYRLGLMQEGGEAFAGNARVTMPGAPGLSLAGARPNPAAGELALDFTLPDAAPATLELLDLAGRVLEARAVGDLGAGRHVVRMGAAATPRPGLYYIRLTRAGRSISARAAVLR